MEIKKTKFIRKISLDMHKSFKRSRVLKLRQEVFRKVMKLGNSTVIIHSELCRLTSEEKRLWFEEELKRGNPVLLELQRIVSESYFRRNSL